MLSAAVVALLALCALSITEPLRQDRQRERRERVVRGRMEAIMKAESRYREGHGVYTGSFSELVGCRLLADSLRFVPYSDGQEFELEATVDIGPTGRQEPMVRVAAEYGQYLGEGDGTELERLREQAANEDRYPGLELTMPARR